MLWLGAGLALFRLGPNAELTGMAPGLESLDERMVSTWIQVETYLAVLGESGRRYRPSQNVRVCTSVTALAGRCIRASSNEPFTEMSNTTWRALLTFSFRGLNPNVT